MCSGNSTAPAVSAGLVGIGGWGQKLLREFHSATQLELCCSTAAGAGREWLAASHPTLNWTDDYEAVLAAPSIDAVVIATPIGSHFEIAARALAHAKHVFVEKPLATSSAEAAELVDLARRYDRRLFVDHTFLFSPGFGALLEQVRDDPVVEAAFQWRKWGSFGESILWNLLPHDVAMLLRLFGMAPAAVSVEGSPADRDCHRTVVSFRFDGGGNAVVGIDREVPRYAKSLDVRCRSGLRYHWRGDCLYRVRDGREEPIVLSSQDALTHAVSEFERSVRTGSSTLSDGEFGVEVVRTLEKIGGQRGTVSGPGAGR
jgi:predicted dehydrogenase